jgi:hypothetical protein
MNLDKSISDLTKKLDELYPSTAFIDTAKLNDGINYWKGKKIIPVKEWNNIYDKHSICTTENERTLVSRKPLQHFPDDYNSSISASGIIDEKLKEEIQNWNTDYYELLEYRKNPTWGRMKCRNCLLSGSLDDPLFIGIEKVFARIVMKHCNNNAATNHSNEIITYHCNVMNIFSCPFESTEESMYPYKREVLFALHEISFGIEQAITKFFGITKDNEIIYEVDFLNDKVKEIHTKYNCEPESWGWNDDVNKQLSKVKPISNIVIRNEQDVYSILTNRKKLELLLQEYEKKNSHRLDRKEGEQLQVCCDENIPCVPIVDKNNDSNNKKVVSSTATTTESLLTAGKKHEQLQQQVQDRQQSEYLHKGENCHSKNTLEGELDSNEKLISNLKEQIKDDLEKQEKEQQILLKDNKQNIIDFILGNIESIRVEDLKIYEPIYKCYREKGNCQICKSLSNIICKSCSNNHKEVWLCKNHWKQHSIEKHE